MRNRLIQYSDGILRTAPLFPVAAGLIVGIALDRHLGSTILPYTAICVAAGAALLVHRARRLFGAGLVLITAAGVGGALHLTTARTLPASSIARYAGATARIARVRGTVVLAPRVLSSSANPFRRWAYRGDRSAFLLDVESIEGVEGDVPVTGRVRVTVREVILDLRENEHVELFGWLYRLRPPANPGSFDWASFYRRQGIIAGFSCNLRENVRRIDPRAPPRRGGLVSRWRSVLRGLLTDDLAVGAEAEASLLEAMILGHRSALDRWLNDVFVRAGCIHFLAVSGTHVVIVLSFFWGVGHLLRLTKRRCLGLIMVVVVIYALAAEPRPPILRATVMALLFCASLLLGRRRAPLNWISAAAVIPILGNPRMIFDAGFQLSFAAVLGVSFLTPALQLALEEARRWIDHALRRMPALKLGDRAGRLTKGRGRGPGSAAGAVRQGWRWLWRGLGLLLTVSLAAWLAGAPIVAVHFNRLHPWGPVNSVLVFPLVYAVMLIGLLKIAAAPVSLTLAAALAGTLGPLDRWLIGIVETLAALPGAAVFVRPPPWYLILLYYLFLASFGRRFSRPGPSLEGRSSAAERRIPRGSRRLSVVCLVAFALGAVAAVPWWRPGAPEPRLTMTVLSVGSGSATVIELPDGRTVLYDAGSASPYDVGHDTIVPFIRHQGIKRIDSIHLSHANLDHFSGVPSIIAEVPTGPIIVNEYFRPRSPPGTPSHHLLMVLAERGHEVRTLLPTETCWESGGVTFERLSPFGRLDETLSTNDTSTVLRLTYAGRSILLTGDVEERTQRMLLGRGRLRADVLVLPHHGSVRPSSQEFIEAVGPEVLIRSSHERMAETFSGLSKMTGDAPLYNTADVGAIQVVIDNAGVHVSVLRPQGSEGCGTHVRTTEPGTAASHSE